jgi:hypothetical protein
MNLVLILVFVFTFVLSTPITGSIVSKKTDQFCQYVYEYYYDATATKCYAVVMINVGTGMSVGNYKSLATSIVAASSNNASTVAIIVNSNPYGLRKDDGTKFAKAANAIVGNIRNILPVSEKSTKPLYFIGGHSGGGKGAMNAIQQNALNFSVAGFVGLDPYQISKEYSLYIEMPALLWGFNKTTCLVNTNEAAKAAYNISNPDHRFFYQVQTSHKLDLLGPHCSFTNNGCFGMCNGGKDFVWIRTQVADTFHHFAKAVGANSFDRSQFIIDQKEVILYANEDIVVESKVSDKNLQQLLKPAMT